MLRAIALAVRSSTGRALGFGLLWMFASVTGGAAAAALALWHPAGLLGAGLTVGAAQGLALRRWGVRVGHWVAATAWLGPAVVATRFLQPVLVTLFPAEGMDVMWAVVTMSLGLGLTQTLALPGRAKDSGWWLLATVVAPWVLGLGSLVAGALWGALAYGLVHGVALAWLLRGKHTA
jgi:hypothetical protein